MSFRVRGIVGMLCVVDAAAQSLGGAGTLRGTVRDTSGSPAPAAVVQLSNAATGFSVQTRSAPDGAYALESIPPNTYRLRVSLPGFQAYAADLAIRSAVAVRLDVRLDIAGQQTSLTVESGAGELVANTTISSD